MPNPEQEKVIVWIIVNIIATVGIVFTNKAVFTDKSLVKMPVSFAAFHFACTSAVLYLTSRSGLFEPKVIVWKSMLPICFVFAAQVILTNLSLAFSSVAFYQMVRILMTPGTAFLNWFLYGITLRPAAICAILLICSGVGVTIYFDAISTTSNSKTTTIEGVFFALSGVAISSIYTIWIGTYAKKHACSSMQLLFNQSPLSTLLLLFIAPFIDTFPDLSLISGNTVFLIFLSGLFAVLINVSQFYIIHGSSAVSSAVVGNAKTCIIIILGWTFGTHMNEWSIIGIALAIAGFLYYTSLKTDSNDDEKSQRFSLDTNWKWTESFQLRITAKTGVIILSITQITLLLGLFASNYDSLTYQSSSDSNASNDDSLTYQPSSVPHSINVLYSFVALGPESERTEITRKNIEFLNLQRLMANPTYHLDCLIFTYAPYTEQPTWIREIEKNMNHFCKVIPIFKQNFVYFLKYLNPWLLKQSGYDYLTIHMDDVVLYEPLGIFDLRQYMDLVVKLDLCIASPAITQSDHETLWPVHMKPGQVGRKLETLEIQSITYRMDAWECWYDLVDTEYPSGWGMDMWFYDYCITSGRIANGTLGLLDIFKAHHMKFTSTVTVSVDMQNNIRYAQQKAWLDNRNISLTQHFPELTIGELYNKIE